MSPSPQLADPAAEVVALRARLDALLGVRAAVRRLAELGPVAEIVDRGPAEAAAALGLGRVLLSRVEDGALVAEALHAPADPDGAPVTLARLQERPVPIDYPLVEGEVLRRRRPQLVEPDPEAPVPASRHAFADAMGWETYVAAPIVLEARVIGFFQGDRPAGPVVGEVERDGLGDFADGFALVFERAILRRRLRIQRQEMRQVASWADARTSELSDRAVTLAFDREPADEEAGGRAVSGAGPDTGDHLPCVAPSRGDEEGDAVAGGEVHGPLHARLVEATGEEDEEFVGPEPLPRASGGQGVEDTEGRVPGAIPRDAEPAPAPLGERHDLREESSLDEDRWQQVPVEPKREGEEPQPGHEEDRAAGKDRP